MRATRFSPLPDRELHCRLGLEFRTGAHECEFFCRRYDARTEAYGKRNVGEHTTAVECDLMGVIANRLDDEQGCMAGLRFRLRQASGRGNNNIGSGAVLAICPKNGSVRLPP